MEYPYGLIEVSADTPDPFADDIGVDVGNQLPYASETRSTFEDLLSAAFRGTASTTTLLGQGAQQLGFNQSGSAIRDLGEYMQSSELAKPDEYQYRGLEDSRAKQIALGVAEGAPYIVGTLGAAAAGTLAAGPVGGVAAGGGFLGLTAGAGTYKATMEELNLKRPDLSEEDKHRFALTESFIQLGTESVGMTVGWGAGKIFAGALTKPVLQAGLRGMVESGEVSATKLAAASLGKASLGDLSKSLGVAGFGEGSSEVAAQWLSEANRESAGLENDPTDLFNVFASAAILGGGVGAVSYASTARDLKRMRSSINYGLSSEDAGIRLATVESLTKRLSNLDPEAGAAFTQTIGRAAAEGPVDLEQAFKIQREYPGTEMMLEATGKISTVDQVRDREMWATADQIQRDRDLKTITTDPSSILKEAGIPSGVSAGAFPKAPMSPYGTAEFVPRGPEKPEIPFTPSRDIPASVGPGPADYTKPGSIPERARAIETGMAEVIPGTNQLAQESSPPPAIAKVQQQRADLLNRISKEPTGPGTASYALPGSIPERTKAIEAGMAQVDPESNQLIPIVPTKASTTRTKGAIPTPKPIAAIAPVVETPVKTEEVRAEEDLDYTAEDLKGKKVKLTGYDPKLQETYEYEEDAYKAVDDINEELSLYEDIKRCVSRG